MPTKPRHPCNKAACGVLTCKRFCDEHERQHRKQADAQRPSSHARGYTRQWGSLRRVCIACNPLCVHCKADGRTVAAQEVDHIVPLSKGGTHDEYNLQALCKSCHSKKTVVEDGALGVGRV